MTHPSSKHDSAAAPPVDPRERGLDAQGRPVQLDRRLFMQLLVLERAVYATAAPESPETMALRLHHEAAARQIPHVIYADATHPYRLGLLSWSEAPEQLVAGMRQWLGAYDPPPRIVTTMTGRTYGSGFERDLQDWLLHRPVRLALDASLPWALWYPLRRKGAFARLPAQEQAAILREHGRIGHAYAEAGLAADIRLACHGLDAEDNEFVIGLLGPRLQPLSHLVQAMRRTRQTAEFVEKMGPFFVGLALHRFAGAA